MHKITAWKAQRSSASMTVVGKDETGQALKVAHIVSIEAAAPYPIATDINGCHYQLVCDGTEVLSSIAPGDAANGLAA